jgi:hypothetical protein
VQATLGEIRAATVFWAVVAGGPMDGQHVLDGQRGRAVEETGR